VDPEAKLAVPLRKKQDTERQGRGQQKIPDELSNHIRRFRMRKGWTILELAEKTGISGSLLAKMELGLRGLNIRNLEKIAVALRVEPKELVFGNQKDLLFGPDSGKPTAGRSHTTPAPVGESGRKLLVYGKLYGKQILEMNVRTWDVPMPQIFNIRPNDKVFAVIAPRTEFPVPIPGAVLVLSETEAVRDGDLIIVRDARHIGTVGIAGATEGEFDEKNRVYKAVAILNR